MEQIKAQLEPLKQLALRELNNFLVSLAAAIAVWATTYFGTDSKFVLASFAAALLTFVVNFATTYAKNRLLALLKASQS